MKRYDYIVAGAGASGLSLLVHMIRSGQFSNKRILLVEKTSKSNNDRTWCFWEKGPGMFDDIVYHSWNTLQVFGENHQEVKQNIIPYHYKLIRGIDFYDYCFNLIRAQPNIDIIKGSVSSVNTEEHSAAICIGEERFTADYVFNSIRFSEPELSEDVYYLQQHFRGWFIRATHDVFDAETATLMDFRTGQQQGTTFFYLMPFSAREALVEYTLFSPSLLQEEEYDFELRRYCREKLNLQDSAYEIVEVETGSIPMTNYDFRPHEGNIINIGTAGGNTKPSSGYTFRFIQKNSEAIVDKLKTGMFPAIKTGTRRHLFYDSVLLNILCGKKMKGSEIFTRLFERNRMQLVLKFLDSETSMLEDLRLISTLPTVTFSAAALDHTKRQLKKKSSKP